MNVYNSHHCRYIIPKVDNVEGGEELEIKDNEGVAGRENGW